MRHRVGVRLLVVGIVAACVAPVIPVAAVPGSPDPEFGVPSGVGVVATLTAESGERYEFSGSPDRLTATAPATVTDGNIREVFWPEDARWQADQRSCATWEDTASSPGSPLLNRQMGLALRIAPATDDGRGIKAVTLTQNIVAGATWRFWVDVWHVTDAATPAFAGVQTFDVAPVVGAPGFGEVPPPWHVCAETVGSTFRFKLWAGADPEPPWDDPDHVFATELPAGWDYPGYAGGYVGHLRASESASFSNLTTRVLSDPSPPRPARRRVPGIAPVAVPVLGFPTYVG